MWCRRLTRTNSSGARRSRCGLRWRVGELLARTDRPRQRPGRAARCRQRPRPNVRCRRGPAGLRRRPAAPPGPSPRRRCPRSSARLRCGAVGRRTPPPTAARFHRWRRRWGPGRYPKTIGGVARRGDVFSSGGSRWRSPARFTPRPLGHPSRWEQRRLARPWLGPMMQVL